jgi:Domain of unknown function (DUF4386)
MTRTTNARIAGLTFLVYIVAGITSMVVSRRATGGAVIAERLATIAGHGTAVGVLVLLGFVQCFSALVLGVTLWAITRDEDSDLAMLGLTCRVGEGVIGGLAIPGILAVFSLATTTGTDAPATAAAQTLATYLLRTDVELPAMFFAVGSTFFSWLLLRGRMIPAPLAWLGIVASVLLVACLPLTLAGFLRGPIVTLIWLPMLAFEVPLGVWLITKGVATPVRIRAA